MSKRLPIFLGILLVCIAVWALLTPQHEVRALIERLENLGYDLQLRTRVLTEKKKPLAPVAIIDIDDKSLAAEGRWPWPREKLAQLVDELSRQGAVVLSFDIFFPEKQANIADTVLQTLSGKKLLNSDFAKILSQNASLFDEDQMLAKSIANNETVLAIGFLPRPETENLLPPPLLTLTTKEQDELGIYKALGFISNIPVLQQAAKGSGFINVFPDTDGIVRRTPLIMEYQGGIYPSLALQSIMTFLGENIGLITPAYDKGKKLEGIQLGNQVIPTDENGQVLIPFIGRSYTFPYYSATDVLHGRLPDNALLGKILFIGTSATGLGDLQATSIESPFPGVEIQATLVNGILQNNFSYIPAWTLGANLFLTILFGLITAFLFPYLGPRTLGSVIVIMPPAMLVINNWIWERTGLILSLLIPVILVLSVAVVNMIYGYLFETRRREQIKTMFGQYVPEKHIDEMLRSKGSFALGGEDREMSVLFADIRSFTTISEGLTAANLVEMLNTFFTPMTEIIFTHRGTIDKYVGDMIMAFWGAPLKDKNHARHAIESALEMQAKVKEMQPMLAEHKWPEIRIGIGINSGIMSVGDMGSSFRRNYTVLGDSVNLGSRAEGLSKYYGAEIVVTEFAQQGQESRFVFRMLDKVRVKGKKLGVAIYEVLCKQSEAPKELLEELAVYHKALELYFHQKWDDALKLMEELYSKYPDKKIYHLYIDRIREFKEHPLPADWDGVYVHTSK